MKKGSLWIRIILYAAIFGLMINFLQKNLTYFPDKQISATPESLGLGFEDIFFETDDNLRLNGWWIPGSGSKITILFFHGNAGNIGHRLEKIKILNDLGLNIFIFDYRGYGLSQGSPDEKGLYRDSRSALTYLTRTRKIPQTSLIYYGESLGGAPAVNLAADHAAKGIILEGVFTSLARMARVHYPFVPAFLLLEKLDVISKITKIKIPVLLIHSQDDSTVPYSMAESLFREASVPKKLVKLSGSHNEAFIVSLDLYKNAIRDFTQSPA